MTNLDKLILKSLISELDLPSYSISGTELGVSFMDPAHGLVFLRSIFEIPGMANRIMDLAPEIKECNMKHNEDPNCQCVVDLKKKRSQIGLDITKNGILFNWDVFDNFWDKLPGDNE